MLDRDNYRGITIVGGILLLIVGFVLLFGVFDLPAGVKLPKSKYRTESPIEGDRDGLKPALACLCAGAALIAITRARRLWERK